MKSREARERAKYNLVKRRIAIIVLSTALIVLVLSGVFYSLVRGNMSEPIISFLGKYVIGTDNDSIVAGDEEILVTTGSGDNPITYKRFEAENLYNKLIGNNMKLIINLYLIFCFVIALIIIYIRISNYITELFLEVDSGLNTIEENVGSYITISEELSPIEDSINRSKDLIKLREDQAKLEEQRKNDLVVYLAHDIKTPLTSVIAYLNLLEESPELPLELRAKYLNITLDKANRLEHLINEFFEITRYNFQTMELETEEIDLYYMLMQMVEEFYPIVIKDGKSIENHIPDGMTLVGDANKLARVFNNVLKNAVYYSKNDSIIAISGKEREKFVEIVISNEGATIPVNKLNSIFEKFFRLDDARSTSTGGAGLGLAIAKEIVELHGGSISAKSEEGVTEFSIIIPKGIKKS